MLLNLPQLLPDATAQTVPAPITAGAVLRFTASGLVLLIAALLIVQSCWLLWATTLLDLSARAAAEEAALPRASRASVESRVRQTLANTRLAQSVKKIEITVNGQSDDLHRLDHAARHDRVAIQLEAPAGTAVPDLLPFLGLSLKNSSLRVRRVTTIP